MNASVLNSNVLVLNRHYMALRVVNIRRAISLLYQQLAEVVSVEDDRYSGYDFEGWKELSELRAQFEPDRHDWIRTVRFQITVPRIVRLLFYDRLPRSEVKLNRRNLFARDRNKCQYCGKVYSSSELSLDHIIPRSHGGGTNWENLVCACLRCNIRKGGRTPEQAHMHLVKKPIKPPRNPILALRLGSPKYACWQTFLDHAYWSVELK